MHTKQARGFTLIEVMITVAIVAILAAIAYPSYLEQIAKGKRSECRSGALQTMQQEERYFGQYNTYIAASAPPAAAKVKNFSGDNAASSACTISAVICDTGQTVAQCIEARSTPKYSDPKGIEYLYVDSNGARGCSIGGTRTTTEKACW
ncbi:MAG: prepilin-type N-terminal cleavage/methylation domain-containing protein [Burkholderiaceae bacterium]|nr:prepilin-type N-terminal cleavage/methylation domain-containing protein [Pseudomonadota bacterium]MCP5219975.1 prepilin-type N-terminal cleavage/methylation domain-containing protein [Burkholderiaceae bacterium]